MRSGHTGSLAVPEEPTSAVQLLSLLLESELLMLVGTPWQASSVGRKISPRLNSSEHSFPPLPCKVGGGADGGIGSAGCICWMLLASPTASHPLSFLVLIFPLTKCWRIILIMNLKVCTTSHYPASPYTQYNPVIKNSRFGVRQPWARIPTTTYCSGIWQFRPSQPRCPHVKQGMRKFLFIAVQWGLHGPELQRAQFHTRSSITSRTFQACPPECENWNAPPVPIAARPLGKHPLPLYEVVLLANISRPFFRNVCDSSIPKWASCASWEILVTSPLPLTWNTRDSVSSLSIFLRENLRMGVPSKKAGGPTL